MLSVVDELVDIERELVVEELVIEVISVVLEV